jgi:hypothetical protein
MHCLTIILSCKSKPIIEATALKNCYGFINQQDNAVKNALLIL